MNSTKQIKLQAKFIKEEFSANKKLISLSFLCLEAEDLLEEWII